MQSASSHDHGGFFDVRDGDGLVEALRPYSAEERAAHFTGPALAPLIYSRHHWLQYKGEYRIREDLRAEFDRLAETEPTEWTAEERDLMLALFCVSVADIALEDLDEFVNTAAVEAVLHERYRLFSEGVVSEGGQVPRDLADEPSGLVALAVAVRRLRTLALERFYLYSDIDGKKWHRTEQMVARSKVDLRTPIAEVIPVLENYGVTRRDDATAAFTEAAARCIAEHGGSKPLLREIMIAALYDPKLRVDHVTITCASGVAVDTPELMTENDSYYTETILRSEVDLEEYQEQIGHADDQRLKNTVRARMLKLNRGATKLFFGPGCMQGRFLEKKGGFMIFRNEDAHYRGHQSIGCSTGGRVSYSVRYDKDGVTHQLQPMVGDFRVVRMTHDVSELFTGEDLEHLIPYGDYLRTVLDETFRSGSQVHPPGDEREAVSVGARAGER